MPATGWAESCGARKPDANPKFALRWPKDRQTRRNKWLDSLGWSYSICNIDGFVTAASLQMYLQDPKPQGHRLRMPFLLLAAAVAGLLSSPVGAHPQQNHQSRSVDVPVHQGTKPAGVAPTVRGDFDLFFWAYSGQLREQL